MKSNALGMGSKGQHELRKTIIRMVKDGKQGNEIANILGVSEGHVSNVKKLYANGGAKALQPQKRGRPAGKNSILTPEQEAIIQKIIVDKHPDQLRFKECMWTRNNIRKLINEKFGIDIKLSTLGYYLARWGFSVQRPVKRAYKQDAKKIDAWLNTEFPGITDRAVQEQAEIFFGDETNIQNTANYARGYAPKGQTPVVEKEAQKLKIQMLSAISKRGKLRFVLYKDSMNAAKLIDFMTRLVTDSKKKVFLILDNLRVHARCSLPRMKEKSSALPGLLTCKKTAEGGSPASASIPPTGGAASEKRCFTCCCNPSPNQALPIPPCLRGRTIPPGPSTFPPGCAACACSR